ncbi:ArsR/SmtB family transcription factor [Jiangella alba]|uniref:DNA-binding transcriptional regulator, ArsR family n=1 Tax=Jiangella alba TaxID=561176 RepID=A0A1H5MLE5_9ACTN|nr:helix-turn-helix domain-containing protein [Jiangella alba]SEE90169.1 DNA-binding transcriptional regulator, ArsR family [Jiangella alba]
MLRLRMTVDDLARTTLALPGRCEELPVSVQALEQIGHPYRGLWRSLDGRVPDRARCLWELIPARGDVPLFLAPELVDDIDEAVDIVQSTPPARIRAEISAGRSRPTPWVDDLCRGRPAALRRLAAAMRAYHDRVMTSLSDVHRRALRAELGRRTHQLAREGIAATLTGLHPSVRWSDGVLEVAGPVHADIDLSGRGLRVMPSVWPRPGFALGWGTPTLSYPVPYGVWLAESDAGRDGAQAALGATRAKVLHALADAHTTTSLARALRISPASASAHTTALRRAGLISSHREGKTMVHTLTSVGLAVIDAAPGPGG